MVSDGDKNKEHKIRDDKSKNGDSDIFGCGFQEDPHHSSPSYSPPAQLWGMWPGDSVGPLDQGSQK